MTAYLAFLVGIACRHRLELGAGAEITARAGEHRHRRLGVGIEGQERIEQLSRRCAIDGVTAMRAVDGDDGHRSIAFDKNCIGIGHGCAPCYVLFMPIENSAFESSETLPCPSCGERSEAS